MAAVTQRIDNYLGGVSRQSDDKKLPGQVRECLNGYPDPTFGLTKRPGFKWIANIGTGTTYDSAKWFYIHRDDDEKYIGCIKPASITVTGNGTSGATNKTKLATTASGSGTGLKVNLTNPDIDLVIEIVNEKAFIGIEKIEAFGGLPVGTGEKALSLISSGIDSPVASFNLLKRGGKLDYIHFHSAPATSTQSIYNVESLLKVLCLSLIHI